MYGLRCLSLNLSKIFRDFDIIASHECFEPKMRQCVETVAQQSWIMVKITYTSHILYLMSVQYHYNPWQDFEIMINYCKCLAHQPS